MKDYLFKYDISVKQFAGKLGISTSYLYQLIRRERKPSIELAHKIEEITEGEVKVEQLLGFETYPFKPAQRGCSDLCERRYKDLSDKIEGFEKRLLVIERGR